MRAVVVVAAGWWPLWLQSSGSQWIGEVLKALSQPWDPGGVGAAVTENNIFYVLRPIFQKETLLFSTGYRNI